MSVCYLRRFERHPALASRNQAALNGLISICIPTYNRPELLREALESCAVQNYEQLELVVGDDSDDGASARVVEAFAGRRSWHVSYVRNVPALGQNANVASLFARANGDRILLLHDDDRLLPGGVAALAAPWVAHPDLAIAFGRVQKISHDGIPTGREGKAPGTAGPIESPMKAALLLQIPSDGYLVSTARARETGYRSDAEVGVYCDKDFSLRLGAALAANQMYFVDAPVSQYRITDGAISQSAASRKFDHARSAIAVYEMLDALGVPASLAAEKEFLVDHLIDKLVKGYATGGRRAKALSLYRSRTYGWKR
jgi:glycosyltransferase involved in cell wall biosynthesis